MDPFLKTHYLTVTASNSKTGDKLSLYYSILDTSVSHRWMTLIDKSNELEYSLRYNYRRNLSIDDIEERFERFKENILYINSNYDRHLTELIDIDHLDQNQYILNDLHQEYEIYGDRLAHLIEVGYFSKPSNFPDLFNPVWPGDKNYNDKVLHERFLLLNEQIHNFEAIFRSRKSGNPMLCTCLFDFMPAGLHEDLNPEDFFLFSPEHQWGWAYLGYNTLGKHWSSASHDNDTEVVLRKQIRPQHRFAAETYLNFTLHTNDYNTRVNLHNWWLKNNFSETINPKMYLDELALGFIPVAKLTGYKVNDDEFKEILEHIDYDDREDWNLNIWSKFDSIIDVRIGVKSKK